MLERTVAITTSNTTSPTVDLTGASTVTLRSPNGDISTVTIHRKSIGGSYDAWQLNQAGTIATQTITLTGTQPVTTVCLGCYGVRFVGNAAGNLEVETTG
jgi:hypothetical protein